MRKIKKIRKLAKKSFVVLGDGEYEKWYLEMLKKKYKDLIINLEPKLPIKGNLLKKVNQIKEFSEVYDKVIWIVDYDVILNQNTIEREFKKYFNELKSFENVTIIINTPCWEFWLLLHFEHTSRFFDNCVSAEQQLKKYLPDYDNSEKYYKNERLDIFARLNNKLETAVKNARLLDSFSFENTNRGVSEMFKLFDVLNLD